MLLRGPSDLLRGDTFNAIAKPSHPIRGIAIVFVGEEFPKDFAWGIHRKDKGVEKAGFGVLHFFIRRRFGLHNFMGFFDECINSRLRGFGFGGHREVGRGRIIPPKSHPSMDIVGQAFLGSDVGKQSCPKRPG